MYVVYQIINLVNGKSYIGSSIRVKQRWKEHRREAFNKNSNKYDYPLYRAFRKYGLDNFNFIILKDDFNSTKEMTDYEHFMIHKLDTLKNGYNQTDKTNRAELGSENLIKYSEQMSQKCAKVDKHENILEIYKSYHDAARKNMPNKDDASDSASSIRNVCKGKSISFQGEYYRDLDENNQIISYPIKRPYNKKSIVGILIDDPTQEIYFESISEAARQMHINRQSLGKCISGDLRYSTVGGYIWRELDIDGNIVKNNIDIQQRIDEYNNTHPLINGQRHNLAEWCKIYDISPNSVYKRMNKKNMTLIEAITTPKRR